jgi:acyl-[acyl carrier protein]--UDP-N-acetylglucosamine O-acyltransferase
LDAVIVVISEAGMSYQMIHQAAVIDKRAVIEKNSEIVSYAGIEVPTQL